MNVDMTDRGKCKSGKLLRTRRPIEKQTAKKAATAAATQRGRHAKTSTSGTMIAGQVTPTGLAKNVITAGSQRQLTSAHQREKQQQLAQLVAKHQQQKQHLLGLVQKQSVPAQQQKIQSLLLQQLATAAQQQQQPIQSFQHSLAAFVPTLDAAVTAANTAGLNPRQQRTAFVVPAASLNSLQEMLSMQLAPMHGCVLVFPVIASGAQVAHSQAVAPHGSQVVTPQRVATTAAAAGQDPVLHQTGVVSAAISTAAQAKSTPKDKPLVRILERKMPHAVAGANRSARVQRGINLVEDDSDQEPGASCTTATTKHLADFKKLDQATKTPRKEPVAVLQEPSLSPASTRAPPQQGPQRILKEKPKKPLSAYNFFFREQRAIISEELESKDEDDASPTSSSSSSSDDKDKSSTGNKRKRSADKKSTSPKKKTVVDVKDITKRIGASWKSIDKATLEKYQAMAAKEKKKYDQDNTAYLAFQDMEWQKSHKELLATIDESTKQAYFDSEHS